MVPESDRKVAAGWSVFGELHGTGEETATTRWAKWALRHTEWEVTGGLYALRSTPRNDCALQVWERHESRACTVCGAAWHGSSYHGREDALTLADDTCGAAHELQQRLHSEQLRREHAERQLEESNRQLKHAQEALLDSGRQLEHARSCLRERDQQLDEAQTQLGEARSQLAVLTRFPTADEWAELGPGARASEAQLRQVIGGAQRSATKRGAVLRMLDGEEFVMLTPLARVLLPAGTDRGILQRWATGALTRLVRTRASAGEAAVRKELRLGEKCGKGQAPWVSPAEAVFQALAP